MSGHKRPVNYTTPGDYYDPNEIHYAHHQENVTPGRDTLAKRKTPTRRPMQVNYHEEPHDVTPMGGDPFTS